MSKRNVLFAAAGLLLLVILLLQIPAINSRVAWRYEVARTYIRNVLNPVGAVPTAIPSAPRATDTASPTVVVTVTPTIQITDTAIPATPTLAPPPQQAALA